MLIRKGAVTRSIAPEKLAEYAERGYRPVVDSAKKSAKNNKKKAGAKAL